MTLLLATLTTASSWARGYASFSGLQALIDNAENGATITLEMDYFANTDEEGITIPRDKSITIDLNGFTIDRRLYSAGDNDETIAANAKVNGYVIKVMGTLTLTDSGTGGKITGGNNKYGGCAGGGVHVFGQEGYYDSHDEWVSDPIHGSFIMNGGTICDNIDEDYGGGVFLAEEASGFVMNGGTISGNKASMGGGVYGYEVPITMTGNASITNNTATSEGGGISDFGIITMSGNASITNNTGGTRSAIYGETLTMSDNARITGNHSTGTHSACQAISCTLTVSGNVRIIDNTNGNNLAANAVVSSSIKITVAGALSSDALIGVTSWTSATKTDPVVITSGLEGKGVATNFTSDQGYDVELNASNEAQLTGNTVTFYRYPEMKPWGAKGYNTYLEHVVKDGNTVSKPADPTYDGFTFDGWYADAACTTAYDFTTPIYSSVEIYPKWIINILEDDVAITANSTYDYGNDVEAVMTVTGKATTVRPSYGYGGYETRTLTPGTDYTVSYTGNINAGTGYVTVTGMGNYTGEVTKPFTIDPLAVTATSITLSATSVQYTGEEQKPAVTEVKVGDTVIPADEYTASYSDNVEIGTATVTLVDVEGGNYIVSGSTTFAITVWGGTGTDADPFVISTSQQLDQLAADVNNGTDYNGKYFRMDSDIKYSHEGLADNGSNYTPAGTSTNSFDGNFDGNGHTVSGIRIYRGGLGYSEGYCGIFGKLGGQGVVKNLTLADTRITAATRTGGIAGMSDGTVSNCHVKDDVTIHAVQDLTCHGGIVGDNRGTVTGCTSAVTLSMADGLEQCWYFGGIAGSNDGTLSYNLVIGATVPAAHNKFYGAVTGLNNTGGTLTCNYYSGCTVAGVSNATGVGSGTGNQDYSPWDFEDRAEPATLLSETAAVPSTLTGTVAFRREFAGGKASTVVFPFEYTPSTTEGKYYTFTGVSLVDGQWTATMAENTVTTLAANTPYLFVPAGTETHTPVLFHGDAVYAAAGNTTVSDWKFVGTYAEKTWTADEIGNDYGFAATSGKATDGETDIKPGDFVMLAEGAHIRPLRSYLTYIGSGDPWTTAGARSAEQAELPQRISVILVDADGTTTEITTTNYTNDTNSDAWYDLSGRKVANGQWSKVNGQLPKGVYIVNGKKVVIK